ncbi:hypothetical protein J3D47_000209 [Pseudomonas laurylsulfativorans]|uniref:hypothetical protein n=1 Tax=Pseudomonas laurylsulfativorans TaxID=1943631 RepID=UPI00209FB445|nr:hypothetical protein [Pseudomonas laurylsulfativorans]MCP1415966.1 hypothetical protein [Pseudomonas laurylsulfativorans]
MKEFRFALLVFIAISAAAVMPYFLAMYTAGNISISSNNQDWGGFGSYIGGVIAPAASLLAGYLVYKSFASNAHQQKLLLARESISRLDCVLEKKLEAPFNNDCFGAEYHGQPLRVVINALSNNKMAANAVTNKGLLSLLHNIAIMTESIRYYIGLLGAHPSTEKDNHWLGDLEKSYWIEKYSAICSRMVRIVGQSSLEDKLSAEQLRSFQFVLGVDNEL